MKNFQNLLTRKMERKEFLVFLGLAILSVSGISGALKNLNSLSFEKNKKVSHGFGKGAYGA